MDSKTRYILLALIILLFLVLAPLIIFYVTGRTLPFLATNPGDTGILDVQTQPSGAQVFLDEESVGSTPATIRFVEQGWHEVKILEKNYRPWVKRLFIQSGEVSYAGSIDDAVRLLPESEAASIAQETTAITLVGNNLILGKTDVVEIYDLGKQAVIRSVNSPAPIVAIQPTHQNNLVFTKFNNNQWGLLNTDTPSFITLPPEIASSDQVELSGSGTVFGRKQNTLYIAGLGQTQSQIAMEGISGFTTVENLIYIATLAGEGELATYYWDNTQLIKQTVLLAGGLPPNTILQLYLTNQKELFVLSNDSLYRVNQSLELIKNSVLGVNLNAAGQRLSFYTPTEIYYYNFGSGRAELLARTTTNLSAADVLPDFGYGFVADQNGSEAIEIDSRGNQNRYAMLTAQPVTSLLITTDETTLLLLANQIVYTVTIKK